MILLPSKGRPKKLHRFIKAYNATGAIEPVCIILEREEKALYKDLPFPDHWIIRHFKGGNGAGSHSNKIFAEFPKLNYYAHMADDIVPHTKNWDQILKHHCLFDKVAYGDDGMDHSGVCGNYYYPTHPFIGGDLVRKWGFIVPPVCKHYGGDAWWYSAGNQVIVKGVFLKHHHWLNDLAQYDETYQKAPQGQAEKQIYRKWRNANGNLMRKDKPDVIVEA